MGAGASAVVCGGPSSGAGVLHPADTCVVSTYVSYFNAMMEFPAWGCKACRVCAAGQHSPQRCTRSSTTDPTASKNER